ncbi:MAG: hypothetical protein GX793_02255 [Bacteroidales bacterium]|jgi:hypothetical protein|nr:hypothetical protein [Bacteroidales bacterium]MCK9498839.1 hypothetical protein [Bacteroidales bacterium]MDY0315644.1 hypothetical protein [Bacteroidales bacterium]NLB85863.1 hypothetical protein [Bacteroidales bacterium]
MQCPNCNKTGNTFQRLFWKKKGQKNRFCIYCNAEVKLIYNWKRIALLSLVILVALVGLNFVLQYYNWPGINGGFAGGIGGALIAIYMRRPAFLKIELINKPKKKTQADKDDKKK